MTRKRFFFVALAVVLVVAVLTAWASGLFSTVPKRLPPITNSIGMKLVYIPPGEFMMGSPEDTRPLYRTVVAEGEGVDDEDELHVPVGRREEPIMRFSTGFASRRVSTWVRWK